MPALTLRPAPLPWVVALRALPAVVVAVAGGAWLALAVGAAAIWIAAAACACVSGWMIGAGGNAPTAAVLAVAAIGGVVLGVRTHSNPTRPARVIIGADVAPEPRAPAHRATPPDRPARVAPGRLVRSYYAAIDAGDFAAAWARLSPAVQARFGGFGRWRDGYATTLGQRVEGVEADHNQIRHTLVARDRTPCGTTVEQRFAVVWTLADGRAAALHAVKVAGQDPAAAC